MTEKLTGYIHLGLKNNWSDVPKVVQDCTHYSERIKDTLMPSYTRITCPICKYIYEVDSSD